MLWLYRQFSFLKYPAQLVQNYLQKTWKLQTQINQFHENRQVLTTVNFSNVEYSSVLTPNRHRIGGKGGQFWNIVEFIKREGWAQVGCSDFKRVHRLLSVELFRPEERVRQVSCPRAQGSTGTKRARKIGNGNGKRGWKVSHSPTMRLTLRTLNEKKKKLQEDRKTQERLEHCV